MKFVRLAALAAVLAVGGSSAGPMVEPSQPGPPRTPVAWVELTGAGQQIRAVAGQGQSCPIVLLDGRPRAMIHRAPPTPDFPNVMCQLAVPAGVREASLEGRRLPLMAGPPRRILIFGDSGCRLKGDQAQDCNRPEAWPFPQVARHAAAMKPDLVIHVGDYYYRESPCPEGRSGCLGSPYGDSWATWWADFFQPAQPLLQSTPFVFARGNHESCARGGLGWTRLLEASDDARQCPEVSPPFKIDLGGLNLYLLDSADAEDRDDTPIAVGRIRQQLDAFGADLARAPGWIVTHRPVWAVAPVARLGPIGPAEVALNRTLQGGVRGRDLSAVRLIVSGHVHHFASYDFGPQRPSQLVAGTGGDSAEGADLARPRASVRGIDGLDAHRLTFQQFGYFIMDRDLVGDGWSGTFRDLHDRVVATCRLTGRDLTCTAKAS